MFAGYTPMNSHTAASAPSRRREGALAAVWLFIGVYPANIYMAWDWRNEEISRQFVSYGRLPFQFLFIWVALRIARANPDTSAPQPPGDVSFIK